MIDSEQVCMICEDFMAIYSKVDELLCDDTFSKDQKFALSLDIFQDLKTTKHDRHQLLHDAIKEASK